jgi:Cap4 dsDNA endonuclease
MSAGPDRILNTGDPGDDVHRRFRYQAVQACCYILALFDEEEGIEEVFCEHHEDILIRYQSGFFLGVQIKTKLDGSVPVKAGDEEVIKSLKRFIETEMEFPGYFAGYLLASNNGFWRDAKNRSNLHHLLEEAKGKDLKTVGNLVQTFLEKLCPKPRTAKPQAASKKPKGAGKPSKQVGPTAPDPSSTFELEFCKVRIAPT